MPVRSSLRSLTLFFCRNAGLTPADFLDTLPHLQLHFLQLENSLSVPLAPASTAALLPPSLLHPSLQHFYHVRF